jgi:hypothetical protein
MSHTARMPGLTADMALRRTTSTYRSRAAGGRADAHVTPQAGLGLPGGRPDCIPDWMCQCVTPGPGCQCCQDDVPALPPFPRRDWM